MKIRFIISVLLVVSIVGTLFKNIVNAEIHQKQLTGEYLLQLSDKIRNPDTDFVTQTIITEYNKAKAVDKLVLKVYSKKQKNSGQYRTLVQFLQPARDMGKLMLQNGNEIWFYDPAAKNSIRVSAQQRLMGQASNSDVMTANFSLNYNVMLIGEEVIKNANRNPRIVYHLYMTAKTKSVTYAFVDFWLEKQNSYPVKAKFYSSSKRLIKIAYYRRFQKQLGRMRPTEVLIIDGVNTDNVTRLQMNNYREIEIPEVWFQRSYLPRFKGY